MTVKCCLRKCYSSAELEKLEGIFEMGGSIKKIDPESLGLCPRSSGLQTPKKSKKRKSDSKVTFGVPVKVTQKLLKSDSIATSPSKKSLLSHF